jgi:hypothetical protein
MVTRARGAVGPGVVSFKSFVLNLPSVLVSNNRQLSSAERLANQDVIEQEWILGCRNVENLIAVFS